MSSEEKLHVFIVLNGSNGSCLQILRQMTYYFEDILNPDAERMLYAISLSQGSKGFLIDACNAYMDNISPEMMQKLKLNKIRSHKDELTKANKMKKPVSLINEALTF